MLQWDVAQPRLQVKFAGRDVVLSPDCRTAICVPTQTADGHSLPDEADPPVEVWDVALERKIDVLGTVRSFGSPIEVLPDGQRLLMYGPKQAGTPTDSPPLMIWDLRAKTKMV